MPLEHEYSLLGGCSRAQVGRWLYATAAAISAVIMFFLLATINLAKAIGVNVNVLPFVISIVGAASVYTVLYWIFNHYGWKIKPVGNWLKLPNLAGNWKVQGVTLEKEPHVVWAGTVTIVQYWDKIRVHMETPKSISDSIAAALQPDAAAGYHLMYHYRNQPRIAEVDLAAHHGFAELTFSADGKSATGEYFNGRGRNTWGTLTLEKEQK
jgi:hypothetical protein